MKFPAQTVVWLAVAAAATATTLAPITLDEQIEGASKIFRGRVEAVTPVEENAGTGRAIVTEVKVARVAVYKGGVPASLTIRLLGGKLGDREMRIDGMPEFEVGKEYVIFLNDAGKRACPVVGWAEGSLPVDPAAGTVRLSETVRRGFSQSAGSAAAAPPDLGKLEAFEAALRAKISDL